MPYKDYETKKAKERERYKEIKKNKERYKKYKHLTEKWREENKDKINESVRALKDKKKKPVGEDQVDEFDGVDSQKDSDKNLMKAIQKKFGTKKGRNLGKFSGNRYWKSDGAGGRVPADMDVTLADPAVKMMLDAGILTLNPSALKQYKAMKGESIVREGEEDKAELVMASKDMVDRLTGWMEDTAEMQSESMLELADAIRDEMGQQESDAFVNTVKPALEQLYASMETTREALTAGVGQLTGEGEAPAMDMGEPMDMEAPMDDPVGDEAEMEPVEDDGMATAPAAVGGEDEAGRARRESRYYKKKAMLETSRRLGTILSKKK